MVKKRIFLFILLFLLVSSLFFLYSNKITGKSISNPNKVLSLPGGTNDYLQINNHPLLNPQNELTLAAWVYPKQWRSYEGREQYGLTLFYKGLIGSHTAYSFKLERNGWLLYGTTRNGAWLKSPVVPLNKWTHLAVTIKKNPHQLIFYVNGNRITSINSDLSSSTAIMSSSEPLYIGGFWQRGWGYNNNNFIGSLDEISMWDRVLSGEEIKTVMSGQLNPSGLIGHWNFDDGTAKDTSGNNLHGQLKGSTSIVTSTGLNLDKNPIPELDNDDQNEISQEVICKNETKITDLYGKWGINAWLTRPARNEQEKKVSYTHLSVDDIIKLKEDYGLGWIAIAGINAEETKRLIENDLLVFHEVLHASQWGYGSDISSKAEKWAKKLYDDNPYLNGIVIDWEEDPSTWPGEEKGGTKLLQTLKTISNERGKILIGEPRPTLGLEVSIGGPESPEWWVRNSDGLFIWKYQPAPYDKTMIELYNAWHKRTKNIDPNFPVIMELASGEPNEKCSRMCDLNEIRAAIINLKGVTPAITFFVGDLMIWHINQNDPPEKVNGFKNNLQILNKTWRNETQLCHSAPIVPIPINTENCSKMFTSSLLTSKNNSNGFDQFNDPRFVCLNGNFYSCGWNSTEGELFAIKVNEGEVYGSWRCNESINRWENMIIPNAPSPSGEIEERISGSFSLSYKIIENPLNKNINPSDELNNTLNPLDELIQQSNKTESPLEKKLVEDLEISEPRGKIKFDRLNISSVVMNNLKLYVSIESRKIEVRSDLKPELNTSAILTFTGINFKNQKILSNHVECLYCEIINFDEALQTLTVKVPHFTVYEVIEEKIMSIQNNSLVEDFSTKEKEGKGIIFLIILMSGVIIILLVLLWIAVNRNKNK